MVECPLIFQEPWIKDLVNSSIRLSQYSTCQYVHKNFVSDELKVRPILRIFKFLKTTSDLGITAILADSKYKILAVFPFVPSVVNFESRYRQRLTLHTSNCLLYVRQAHLKFITRQELSKDYQIYFDEDIDIVVMEVVDVDIFSRDQYMLANHVENTFRFLYHDFEYILLCRKHERRNLNTIPSCDSDSIKST